MKSLLNRTKAEEERIRKNYKTTLKSNKMVIRTYILIIMLNINGLNASTKRQTVAEWINKQDLYIYTANKRLTSDKDIHKNDMYSETETAYICILCK